LGSACRQTCFDSAFNCYAWRFSGLFLLILDKRSAGPGFPTELAATCYQNRHTRSQQFFRCAYTCLALQCTSATLCPTNLQLQLYIASPQSSAQPYLIFDKLVGCNHHAKHINMVITAKTDERWNHASTDSTAIFFYYSPSTEFPDTDTSKLEHVLCFLDACDATTAAATASTKTGVATTNATAKDKYAEQWIG
jgi:hypothetical protein